MSLIKKVGRKIIYRLIKKSPLIMRIYIKKYNRFPEWIALYKIISL